MFLRLILRRFGLLAESPRWDLISTIKKRINDYRQREKTSSPIIRDKKGIMITVHKLNNQDIAINADQIQSVESMGSNALIIFTTGNRMLVRESAEAMHQLLEQEYNKKTKGS